jgi:hypothetical protein
MTTRRAGVILVGTAAAVSAVLLSTSGSETSPRRAVSAALSQPAAAPSASKQPKGTTVDCSRRSEAGFPGGFTDPQNVVVGPLALMGAAYTEPSVVRESGGNKFPLLVKAGHTVTVRVRRRSAGLAYAGLGNGPLPQGQELKVRDTADTMTFVACKAGRPPENYRPEGPSATYADGEQVTFWSGFVLTEAPACVPLDVYVDDERAPRRVGLSLGRHCA